MLNLFRDLGFEECSVASPEQGFEKIAVYEKQGLWTHAARQLETGRWTSKLGKDVDIEHRSLAVLFGPLYGSAVKLMRRRRD